jgi:DNA-directed RNA polymerase subunit RPC12/RpoP
VTAPAETDSERYPCPKCGAGLHYDPAAKGLRCPFCGESRSVEGGGPAPEKDLLAALTEARRAHEEKGRAAPEARRTVCDACGAEVLVPPTERAGRCAYCGSTRVLEEAAGPGRIPPDSCIPFAVDRAGAEERFRAWIRSLWFRPNALRRDTALAEMRGVMVPYWTFDARAESSWSAMAGHYYYVTVGAGKNARRVRQVRWTPASGRRRDAYDDLLVLASRGLEPGLIAEIEPFRTGGLVPFRPEYLAGWSAEAYAVDVAEGWKTAQGRIHADQERRCAGDVPGDTHRDLRVETALSGLRYRHALLPVWVAAYIFRGKTWRFLVNGQTGEVQGRAPLSWVKILLLVLGVAAAVVAVVLVASRS